MNTTNQQNHPLPDEGIFGYINEVEQARLEEHKVVVRKARNALFWAAGLIFLGEMVSMGTVYGAFELSVFVIAVVEAAIFIALGLWTKKKPYSAVVGGIVAFIAFMVFAVLVNAYTDGVLAGLKVLASGVIIKIFILVTLFKAVGNARAIQNAQRDVF